MRKSNPNDFNTPGCIPGSTMAISQHKAISMGYAAPASERRVKTNQKSPGTGCAYAPGLNSHKR